MESKKKRVLFLGAPSYQIRIVQKAKEMGLRVGIVDINPEASAFPYADECFVQSTRDKEGVLQIAKEFKPDGIIIGANDTPVLTGAYVCEALGLAGNSVEAAINATNKVKMLEAFERCGVAHPLYQVVKKDEIETFTMQLPYPVISKPVDSAGGRGISIINNSDELMDAMRYSSKSGISGDILIEEYMNGREVSVEVLVVNGKPHVIQITDKMTSGEPNFFEIGHCQPSTLPNDIKERIKDLASRAVLAVGIKNSPAHVEVMMTKQGPKMIELGARLGSDCITTYLADTSVAGVSMAQATIELALGIEPDVSRCENSGLCAAVLFIPAEEGVLTDIRGLDEAKASDGLVAMRITDKIGKHYSRPVDNTSRLGYVVCSGDSTESALEKCRRVIEKLNFVYDKNGIAETANASGLGDATAVKTDNNNSNLIGKRLLFLGGPIQVLKAVEQAKKMGIYTIVTDIKEDALAKGIADEALPFSVLDTDGIIAWCKQNPVDGVLNFGVDPAQKPNVIICEALGLPHFATLEQVEYLSNKKAFKALCEECGVDIIKSYTEDDITDCFDEYPILVKPAQNCGSRGNSVCHNKQEADAAISCARENSLNGEVIIERYMQGYHDFSVEYFAVDGNIFLVRTQDRYLGSKLYKLDRQAVGGVSPSKYTDSYIKNVHPKVVKMLEHIDITNGVLTIQGFIDGETVRFYDPAYRFPGSAYEKLLFSATGVNLMEYAICFALGAKKEIVPEFYDAYKLNGKCSIMLLFTARSGVIGKCCGMDDIKGLPEVVSAVMKESVGSVVPASGDVRQRIAEVGLLVDDDKATIENTVFKVQSMLTVLDENGENMLVSLADPRLFRD